MPHKQKNKKLDDKQYVCTTCGGDATVAWHNTTKKDKDYFGAILRPGERLCLGCGAKRGVNFSFHKK